MGCEWYNPASYGSCAVAVAKSAAGDAFHAIAESFAQSADHAVAWLWNQIAAATAVRLGGSRFSYEVGATATIAATVAVGLFVIQVIQSVLRREAAGLGRAARGLLIASAGAAAAITVVNLLLGATDDLSEGVVRVVTGQSLAKLGPAVLKGSLLTASVNGAAALLLLSLACIAATVVVYGALVMRKVLIVITAVFAPIAFAGSLADITVSWTRRWIETTIALIVSKLVLVLVLAVGYEVLINGAGQSGSGAGEAVTQVISGILVLSAAGFAPLMALKVVRFTGEHASRYGAVRTTGVAVASDGRVAQRAAPYVPRSTVVPAAALASTGGHLGAEGPVTGAGAVRGPVTGAGAAGGGGSDSTASPDTNNRAGDTNNRAAGAVEGAAAPIPPRNQSQEVMPAVDASDPEPTLDARPVPQVPYAPSSPSP